MGRNLFGTTFGGGSSAPLSAQHKNLHRAFPLHRSFRQASRDHCPPEASRSRMQTKALALVLAGGIGMFALVNSVLAQGWIATSAPVTNWFALTASADGTTVMAAINRNPYQIGSGGPNYLSTDSGTNWTLASAPVTNWIAVASSADGTRLVAAVGVPPYSSPSGSTIYISTNSGTSWIVSSEPVTNWVAVASSADGT